MVHPEWGRDMVLYEINTRQFSKEGTFQALENHLPRIRKLGANVLWLMPVHPIGQKNRKGELGSYYSVSDFRGINPEHGTMDDFLALLEKAHSMGFRILLDWVPNHTSWDHPWTREHPDWYEKTPDGSFVPPKGTDWTDVVQLDWSNGSMQEAMLEDMRFWVEKGVDGFRVDHPHNTPPEFWERARKELCSIRQVLLLAENEEHTAFMEKGFDMNYAWELHHLMNDVAKGRKGAGKLRRYFRRQECRWSEDIYRLNFLTNHDENSWAGTIGERLGETHEAFAVFLFSIPGVPMLYGGQEACLDKRLEFFQPDPIDWKECRMTSIYENLCRIKRSNPALGNGASGGRMRRIKTGKHRDVIAFSREKEGNRVLGMFNLSSREVSISPGFRGLEGKYKNAFTGAEIRLPLQDPLTMNAWSYMILVR